MDTARHPCSNSPPSLENLDTDTQFMDPSEFVAKYAALLEEMHTDLCEVLTHLRGEGMHDNELEKAKEAWATAIADHLRASCSFPPSFTLDCLPPFALRRLGPEDFPGINTTPRR